MKTIIIEHDGTGSGAGWFCDYVEVKYNSNTVKYGYRIFKGIFSFFAYLRFPVGRWLDVDEGDKRISLELEPNKKPPQKIVAGN